MNPENIEQHIANIAQCFLEAQCHDKYTRLRDVSSHSMDTERISNIDSTTCKNEDSTGMDENDLKEELIDSEEAVIKTENTADTIWSSLEKIPIVYTTKLDNMQILQKKFRRLHIDDIVDNILVESKPKLSIQPVKTLSANLQMNSFCKLVENITRFNKFARRKGKTNMNEKSLQLLKQCKPIKIMLTDYRKEAYRCCIDKSDPSSEKKKSIQIHDRRLATPSMNQCIILSKSASNCLAFIDFALKRTELYYIDSMNDFKATFYVCLSKIIPISDMPLNGIVMANCCWFAREITINSINKLFNTNFGKNSATIMKIPHRCPIGRCFCCCKKRKAKGINIALDIPHMSRRVYTPVQPKSDSWLTNFTTKKIFENSAKQNKAFNYTPNLEKSLSRHIKIRNTYTNKIEIYLVKKYVNHYIEVNDTNSDELNHLVENIMFTHEYDNVCCWYRRDSVFWSERKQYSPDILNILRTRHTCPEDDCKCCCKFLIQQKKTSLHADFGSKDTHIPKDVVFSKNYSNKTFQRRKMLVKNIKSTREYVLKNLKPILNHKDPMSKEHVNMLLVKPMPRATPSQTGANFSSPAPIKVAQPATQPLISNSKQVVTEMSHNLPGAVAPTVRQTFQLPNSIQPQQTLPSSQGEVSTPVGEEIHENADPTVTTLVETILERFRNVRLLVAPDGNIVAEINSPLESLTTAELKILSTIITRAKEQLNALKSNPEMSHLMMPSGIPLTNELVRISQADKTQIGNSGIPKTPVINPIITNPPVTSVGPSSSSEQSMLSVPAYLGMPGALERNPVVLPAPLYSRDPDNTSEAAESIFSKASLASGITGISRAPTASFVPANSGVPSNPILESILAKPDIGVPCLLNASGLNPVVLQMPCASGSTDVDASSKTETLNAPPPDALNSNKSLSGPSTIESVETPYSLYTNFVAIKSKEYISSYNKFMKSQLRLPTIRSVFSLKDATNVVTQPATEDQIQSDSAIPGPSCVKRKRKPANTDKSPIKRKRQRKPKKPKIKSCIEHVPDDNSNQDTIKPVSGPYSMPDTSNLVSSPEVDIEIKRESPDIDIEETIIGY